MRVVGVSILKCWMGGMTRTERRHLNMVNLQVRDSTGGEYGFFTKESRALLKSEEKVEVLVVGLFGGEWDKVVVFTKPERFIGSGRVDYALNLLTRIDWRRTDVVIKDTILDPIPEKGTYKGRMLWSLGEKGDHYLSEASIMLADGHVNKTSLISYEINSDKYREMGEKGLLAFYSERVGFNEQMEREA